MQFLLVFVGLVGICTAINLRDAKEGSCFDPPLKSVEFNKEAFADTKKVWYHHIWSKYYLYRVAADITAKHYSDISEDDLKNSCLSFSAEGAGIVGEYGFNGGHRTYELGPGKQSDSFQWRAKGNGNPDYDAETWVTMAGDDYFVAVTCYHTNQRAFTAVSLKKTLDSKLSKDIHDHVRSLGFTDEYFYDANPSNCQDRLPTRITRHANRRLF